MSDAAPSLVVHGAGRMGQRVAALASEAGYDVLGLVSRAHPGDVHGLRWFPGLDALSRKPDLIIDFTLPAGAAAAGRWCGDHGVALVSGTTGLDEIQARILDEAARRAPVLHSPNFSPGINAALVLLRDAVRMLPDTESVSIRDVHHVHKLDAPSGTALALADAVAPHAPDIESRREGEVVGDHAVTLQLPGESLTLAHHVSDRDIFARGALAAGRWLLGQAPGRYTARDWITGTPV